MKLTYLLDTNICIYIIKEKPADVIRRFLSLTPDDIGISTITLAELEYGVSKSQHPERNRQALEKILRPLQILSFDEKAAFQYGQIRKNLEKSGTPLGSIDYLIAAHALSLGAVLVTNNENEFNRVRSLRVENWAKS